MQFIKVVNIMHTYFDLFFQNVLLCLGGDKWDQAKFFSSLPYFASKAYNKSIITKKKGSCEIVEGNSVV